MGVGMSSCIKVYCTYRNSNASMYELTFVNILCGFHVVFNLVMKKNRHLFYRPTIGISGLSIDWTKDEIAKNISAILYIFGHVT